MTIPRTIPAKTSDECCLLSEIRVKLVYIARQVITTWTKTLLKITHIAEYCKCFPMYNTRKVAAQPRKKKILNLIR